MLAELLYGFESGKSSTEAVCFEDADGAYRDDQDMLCDFVDLEHVTGCLV